MSVTPTITMFLIVTPPLCLITNSWLMLWIILEINTMAFCTLISMSYKKNKKKSTEVSMKYLIVQSIASAVLLLYMASHHQGFIMKMVFYGGISALFMKVASVPFHSWFISVMKKSSWDVAMTLMTWQKLAPMYLIMFLLSPLITLSMILTAAMGSSSQLNKKDIKEILALSSIFNLSWMMAAISLSLKVLVNFLIMYWISLFLAMVIIKKSDLKRISKEIFSKNKEWLTLLILASLAGIPPTLGFLAKWTVLTSLLMGSLTSVTTMLLILSAINLYVYLRLSTNLLMKMKQTKQTIAQPPEKKLITWMLLMNAPVLMMVMYG